MRGDGGALGPRRALLAVPGALDTPTGGYRYARRLIEETAGGTAPVILRHWPLPGGFPRPAPAALEEAARRLALAPAGWPIIVDGLALGAMPPRLLAGAAGPLIALVHHPLALETGLPAETAAALAATERAALAACARVIATSETTAATLRRDYGVEAGRLGIAPPGTDPAPHAAGSGASGTVELLSVGSLTPRKGHDVLVEALARLPARNWNLTIVGPERDRAHARALRGRIEQAGLAARISLPGAIDEGRLARLWHRADLFVLASHHEGYGMAYTEAMARGLPVVGCDVGAVAEATAGAALLVPPGDPDALAAALEPLIASPGWRAGLAARCRRAAAALPRWTDTVACVAAAVSALEGAA